MRQIKPNQHLVEAIRQGTFAIVGSGFSRPADAPSWTALLWAIAYQALDDATLEGRKAIGRALTLSASRPLDAAEILKDVVGRDFHEVVSRAVTASNTLRLLDGAALALERGEERSIWEGALGPTRRLVPTATHRTFVQLGFRVIVTTNFDNLLEDASAGPRLPVHLWNAKELRSALQQAKGDRPLIVKLHGDVDFPNSFVLAREEFRTAAPTTQEAIGPLFPLSKPLIVGYGHADPDIDPILDRAVTHAGYSLHTAEQRELTMRVKNIGGVPIELESHDDVPRYIAALARALKTPFVVRFIRGGARRAGHVDRIACELDDELRTSFVWWREGSDNALEVDGMPEHEELLHGAVATGNQNVLSLLRSFGVTTVDAGDRRYDVPPETTRVSLPPAAASGGSMPGVGSDGASANTHAQPVDQAVTEPLPGGTVRPRESVFVPVSPRLLGAGRQAHFDFVSPQYLDLQNLCLDQPGFVYPSADDIEQHLITLLMIFPTIVINRAFLFQSSEIGEILARIPDDELREMFNRGWFTLHSLYHEKSPVQEELNWDAFEKEVFSLVTDMRKLPRVRDLFDRLRNLGARIPYVSQHTSKLSPLFRERLLQIANNLVPAQGHEKLVQRMSFLSREDRNTISETVESVRQNLLRIVKQLHDEGFAQRARKNIYNEHKLVVEFRDHPNVLSVEQRLLKAALDVSYAANAPSELGFSTTFAGYNTPFDLAAHKSSEEVVKVNPSTLRTLHLHVPYRLRELLAIRPPFELGAAPDGDGSVPGDERQAFDRWWNLTVERRLLSPGVAKALIKTENLRTIEREGALFFQGDTLKVSGVHVAPEVRRSALSEFSILFAKPLDGVTSGRDFGAVLSETTTPSEVKIVG